MIRERLRLEKTFKTIKPNHLPNPARSTTTPCPRTSMCFLNSSRDSDFVTSLGNLFQYLIILSVNKFFLVSNLDLPWCNRRPFPSVVLQGSKVLALLVLSWCPVMALGILIFLSSSGNIAAKATELCQLHFSCCVDAYNGFWKIKGKKKNNQKTY